MIETVGDMVSVVVTIGMVIGAFFLFLSCCSRQTSEERKKQREEKYYDFYESVEDEFVDDRDEPYFE